MVTQTLYCGGPSIGLGAWLKAPNPTDPPFHAWPQMRDRLVIGTYRGRSAIALACKLLGLGPGHEILVPAYHCGTEIDALLSSGARIVAFNVSRRCEIDLADLISRRTPQTRAVYLIHYFGWEQPMESLRNWCNQEGLLLIEDCALSLFSQGSSGTLGRVGDAAIYSLSKTLGSCLGGLLSLPAAGPFKPYSLTEAGLPAILSELQHSARHAMIVGLERLGLYGVCLAVNQYTRHGISLRSSHEDERPRLPEAYYFNPARDADRGIHFRTSGVANSLSTEKIFQRRRHNYLHLATGITHLPGVEPLYQRLPTAVCPLSFPLLAANRDQCVGHFQSKGVTAIPWWAGFHRKSINWSLFPDAVWLKNHLLTLPIHQGLDDRHVSYVAKTLAQCSDADLASPERSSP